MMGLWSGYGRARMRGSFGGANKDILVTATDAEGALDALKEYRVSADTLKLEWGKQ